MSWLSVEDLLQQIDGSEKWDEDARGLRGAAEGRQEWYVVALCDLALTGQIGDSATERLDADEQASLRGITELGRVEAQSKARAVVDHLMALLRLQLGLQETPAPEDLE